MKKTIHFLLVVILILNISNSCLALETEIKPLDINDSMRLNDMVITLLMPELVNTVNAFYSQYLTRNPTIVPYFECHITNIKGSELIHEGIQNSEYTVTVEVLPYIGAHTPVGKDRISVHFFAEGIVKVEKYEHLESYGLPPHLRYSIIKPLP